MSKSRKIVLPEQESRRTLHGGNVGPSRQTVNIPLNHWSTHRSDAQVVDVLPTRRTESGMKALQRYAQLSDRNIGRQKSVHRPLQNGCAVPPRAAEGDYLTISMNAGVGPPCSMDTHKLLRRPLERIFELPLDGRAVGLHLKPRVIRTIVLDQCPIVLRFHAFRRPQTGTPSRIPRQNAAAEIRLAVPFCN